MRKAKVPGWWFHFTYDIMHFRIESTFLNNAAFFKWYYADFCFRISTPAPSTVRLGVIFWTSAALKMPRRIEWPITLYASDEWVRHWFWASSNIFSLKADASKHAYWFHAWAFPEPSKEEALNKMADVRRWPWWRDFFKALPKIHRNEWNVPLSRQECSTRLRVQTSRFI